MINIIFLNNEFLCETINNESITLPQTESIIPYLNDLKIIHQDQHGLSGYITNDAINFNSQLKTIPIRQALSLFPIEISQKIVEYKQWMHYYLTHQFCNVCGQHLLKMDQEKFLICKSCHYECYPKLAPSIIVRIKKDNEILLARGVNFPPNVWGLIAGFVELGETLEETVRREVMEEVGIEIDNIRYWGSQSWCFPTSSLMIGFTADYKSGEIKIDNEEIVQAGFFSVDNIPGIPSVQFSIAYTMINDFR